MKAFVSITLQAFVLALLAACGDDTAPKASPTLFDAPAQGSSSALGAELTIPKGAATVVFVGDSIGAGLHLAEHEAFPALLQQHLAAEDLPFRLVNASESGRTSAGGVTALAWVLRAEPDVVVIELGGNDGLRGIALDDLEKNLRTIVADARAAGATVLLLGMRLPRNYGDYGTQFDALFPRLAQELELAFVPYFMRDVGGVAEMNLPDGLHPTAAGHVKLAETVLPALRDLVRQAADE